MAGGRKETNKTGMQHLDVGDTRLLRQKKIRAQTQRVQTTEANEGQVDMWSRTATGEARRGGGETGERSREFNQASSRGLPQCGANWMDGFDGWVNLVVVLPCARRRVRPRFSQIELDPPLWSPELG